jgi:atypical dual specificity phosphatase
VRVQKRAHWITSQSESQFLKLDGWLAKHSAALRSLLGTHGPVQNAVTVGPNLTAVCAWEGTKYILYGEWMVAKHTVHYDSLPDVFLAFDVLNVGDQSFLTRSETHQAAAGSVHRPGSDSQTDPGAALRGQLMLCAPTRCA